MEYYPVYLDLRGQRCTVIGGGRVAERKIKGLLRADAEVTVISPDLTPGLQKLSDSGEIKHKKRRFRKGDTKGALLVIAATSDEEVNRRVYEEAQGLINSVDMPQYCNFIVPSVVHKGPLKIAISSSGISPAVSRTLRKELEGYIPDELAGYLRALKKVRERVKREFADEPEKRTRLLKMIGDREVLDIMRDRGVDRAMEYIRELLEVERP